MTRRRRAGRPRAERGRWLSHRRRQCRLGVAAASDAAAAIDLSARSTSMQRRGRTAASSIELSVEVEALGDIGVARSEPPPRRPKVSAKSRGNYRRNHRRRRIGADDAAVRAKSKSATTSNPARGSKLARTSTPSDTSESPKATTSAATEGLTEVASADTAAIDDDAAVGASSRSERRLEREPCSPAPRRTFVAYEHDPHAATITHVDIESDPGRCHGRGGSPHLRRAAARSRRTRGANARTPPSKPASSKCPSSA